MDSFAHAFFTVEEVSWQVRNGGLDWEKQDSRVLFRSLPSATVARLLGSFLVGSRWVSVPGDGADEGDRDREGAEGSHSEVRRIARGSQGYRSACRVPLGSSRRPGRVVIFSTVLPSPAPADGAR